MNSSSHISTNIPPDIMNELYVAATSGDIEYIRNKILSGYDPDRIRFRKDETLLMLAAGHGQLEIVILLIRHGANINAVSRKGSFALSLAVASGQLSTINELAPQTAPSLIIHTLNDVYNLQQKQIFEMLYELSSSTKQDWLIERFKTVFHAPYTFGTQNGLCNGVIRASNLFSIKKLKVLLNQLINMSPQQLKNEIHKNHNIELFEFMKIIYTFQYPHVLVGSIAKLSLYEWFVSNQFLHHHSLMKQLMPVELTKQGGMTVLTIFSTIITKTEFKDAYLSSLKDYLIRYSQNNTSHTDILRLTLILVDHALQIAFNFKKGKWIIIETNQLPIIQSHNNEDRLVNNIFSNELTNNNILPFCTEIMIENKHSDQMRPIIFSWLSDTRMKEILSVNKERANLTDSQGYGWLDVAPLAGNVAITQGLRSEIGFFKRNKKNTLKFLFFTLVILTQLLALILEGSRNSAFLQIANIIGILFASGCIYFLDQTSLLATKAHKKVAEKYEGIRFFPDQDTNNLSRQDSSYIIDILPNNLCTRNTV